MHPMYHPLFVQFLTYFNGNQDYFECHEVLEEYWKELAPGDKSHPLTGWIQLATGLYHWRRENYTGAETILKKAYITLEQSVNSSFMEEMDGNAVLHFMQQAQKAVEKKEPFEKFILPITATALKTQVHTAITLLPKTDAHFLQHKHMLRDRSDILLARDEKRRSRH
ncbi:DUF309 domain-containing protein [Viridibacillus sp. YIM B01967]|uniref:DUF309 domain-containing protein n=1 Tax=Viridibacillus soli TaxID=2798301 RepID=A0ABS1H4C4_9BACL|nr:DUF309 domain-containing protein [Viridibacillus soli]MBK3494273.1 DUF309 domain-containing protein [Viridibacillus soli]